MSIHPQERAGDIFYSGNCAVAQAMSLRCTGCSAVSRKSLACGNYRRGDQDADKATDGDWRPCFSSSYASSLLPDWLTSPVSEPDHYQGTNHGPEAPWTFNYNCSVDIPVPVMGNWNRLDLLN